jgi:hypothetical protein
MKSFKKLLSGGAAGGGLTPIHQGCRCFEKTFERGSEPLRAD